VVSLEEIIEIASSHGETDVGYLRHHYGRFLSTLHEFNSTWDTNQGKNVLDIGAHWLHQSILWRRAGFDVTAVDLPSTFELSSVQALAREEGIKLLCCPDLEQATILGELPESHFHVVLLTEVIEHFTFNPVEFWKRIYRLLAPGGRIVVTTPNYYSWKGRAWNLWRFISGCGGGISVDDIINMRTYGHHWREYSKRELIHYFRLLSPDFITIKAKTVRNYYPREGDTSPELIEKMWELIPALRLNLHLEVELRVKERGIVAVPSW